MELKWRQRPEEREMGKNSSLNLLVTAMLMPFTWQESHFQAFSLFTPQLFHSEYL
jgi:hypothetical protein